MNICIDDFSRVALRTQRRAASPDRGYSLLECMVYMSVFLIVTGGALAVFHNSWQSAQSLRRNTADIAIALEAGEHWRACVRRAAGPVRTEDTAAGQLVHIPQKTGEVVYRLSEGTLWRSSPGGTNWIQVLANVKSSSMNQDRRQRATAWKWELELKTSKQFPTVRPLFTFEAVPATANNP
jgi:type II secretory pathway component PulJ